MTMEEESTHYRERERDHNRNHSPNRRHNSARRGGTDIDHHPHHHHHSRHGHGHSIGHEGVGDYVARRLIPTVMDRSDRPLKVVMNFGEMKLNADTTEDGTGTSPVPNAIIYNAPGSTLRISGATDDTAIVDRDALRRRIARGGQVGLSYSTLPGVSGTRRRAGEEGYVSCFVSDGRRYGDYDRDLGRERVDTPLGWPERAISFERGRGRPQARSGVCLLCRKQSLVDRRGHCDKCEHRLLGLSGRKDRYDFERDDLLEYSTVRSPLWREELSEVGSIPRSREWGGRHRASWPPKSAGYESDASSFWHY